MSTLDEVMNYKNKEKIELKLLEDTLLSMATVNMEQLINKSVLDDAFKQSGLPEEDRDQFVGLTPEYFRSSLNSREGANFQKEDAEGIRGYSPAGIAPRFLGDKGAGNLLNDKLVLQIGDQTDTDILPNLMRHEYKHRNLPKVEGSDKNYGYLKYPGSESMNSFLNQYEKHERGEEQAAEAFAGREMPEWMRRKILGYN